MGAINKEGKEAENSYSFEVVVVVNGGKRVSVVSISAGQLREKKMIIS